MLIFHINFPATIHFTDSNFFFTFIVQLIIFHPNFPATIHSGPQTSVGIFRDLSPELGIFCVHQLIRGLFTLRPPAPSGIVHFGATNSFGVSWLFFFMHCPTYNFSHQVFRLPVLRTLYCILVTVRGGRGGTLLMVLPLILRNF